MSCIMCNSSSRSTNCNMYQTQAGCLKLGISPLVKLSALSTYPVSVQKFTTTTPRRFRGTLKISNNGTQFIAFKVMIMNKVKEKLSIQPSYGFIMPDEVVKLEVYARNIMTIHQNLSALILATSCGVIEESLTTRLPAFWRNVLRNGSKSFVEVLEIENFQFCNSNGDPVMTPGGDLNRNEIGRSDHSSSTSSSSSNDDNNNDNGVPISDGCIPSVSRSSSLYTVTSYFQLPSGSDIDDNPEFSDASGDASSNDGRHNQNTLLTKSAVRKLTELSNKRRRRHKIAKYIRYFFVFLLFLVYLTLTRVNMRKIEGSMVMIVSPSKPDGWFK